MKTVVESENFLLDILQKLSPASSKNTLKSWVEQGRVAIDGLKVSKWQQKIKQGQEITIGPKFSFSDEGIKILYEDKHLVVIEKPNKLLSVASLDENEITAQAILRRRLQKRVFPVHRLDKDTSGVMVFAYSEKARDALKEQFANHSIDRIYFALVEGILEPKKGTWRSYLSEDDFYFVKSSSQGKLAITHYELIEKRENCSLVKFKLETGRKNQIRVHASDAGFPILGDRKYGSRSGKKGRLYLHAHTLGFYHPVKEKKMVFTSILPISFAKN